MRAGSLIVMLSLSAVLAGCASRHSDVAPTRTADAQGNATVRKVTYFAAWVDERAPASASGAAAEPASTASARAAVDKRAARGKSKTTPTATPPAPPAKAATAADRTPQPRYEYTVELDGGGYRTLVGNRDLGIHVNDRVTVQGNAVTALAN